MSQKPARGIGDTKMGRFLLSTFRFTLSGMVGALLTLALLNFRFIVFDDGAFRIERKREWSLQGTFHWNAPASGTADAGLRPPTGKRSTTGPSTRGLTRSSLPTQAPGSGSRIFQTVVASPASGRASPSASPAPRPTRERAKGRGTGSVGRAQKPAESAAAPGVEDCVAARTRVANAVGAYNRQHQDPMTGLDLFLLIEIGALDELPACPSGGEFTQSSSGTILCSSH